MLLSAAPALAQDTTRTRQPPRPAPADTSRPRRDTLAVIPANPRADTLPVVGDTARPRPDSLGPAVPLAVVHRGTPFDSLAGDSLRAPTARAEAPVSPAVGPSLRWDRTELFASGALTLDELLARLPGVTTFTSGWVVAPHVAGVGGDFSRLRVFLDGIELDRMDPLRSEALDLTQIPLWTLEEVAMERVAGEVRVHLRSWRTRSTTPRTRTDIFTGDRQTEIFRGIFGQRYRGGFGLQLGGQSLSTVDNRAGGGGDQQAYVARFAWARRSWSFDAYGQREQHRRGEARRLEGRGGNLPKRGIRSTFGYLRAAYGDPQAGAWAQLVASGHGSAEQDAIDSVTPGRRAARMQYLATGGTAVGPARVSVAQRMRVFAGQSYGTTSARATLDRSTVAVSGFAERDGLDSLTRFDVTARVTALQRVSLLGSIRRARATRGNRPASSDLLAEAGLRLRGTLWLSGGITTRDTSRLRGPRIFDSLFVDTADTRATATFVILRGRIWRDLYADLRGTKWSDSGAFRPKYDARAEAGVRTQWLRKFPRRTFEMHFAMIQDYRSRALFPRADSAIASGVARTFSTLLEIRILSAVLSWQYRNPFGSYNEVVPGYFLLRRQNLYGVRWDWYN